MLFCFLKGGVLGFWGFGVLGMSLDNEILIQSDLI